MTLNSTLYLAPSKYPLLQLLSSQTPTTPTRPIPAAAPPGAPRKDKSRRHLYLNDPDPDSDCSCSSPTLRRRRLERWDGWHPQQAPWTVSAKGNTVTLTATGVNGPTVSVTLHL
ncbi:E4 [Macaca mulatta papillomavirus 3]|uniref:E4 n=1 Tax=Macaca mulatta papillomavirus 3 TaxID=2294151 RepID=A0A385AHE3_9PAPI|nr:E4 [Macaca mulatta papillomavirus 3]AXN57291.1 E4 [Macaca mulatta papillomavirus 3]